MTPGGSPSAGRTLWRAPDRRFTTATRVPGPRPVVAGAPGAGAAAAAVERLLAGLEDLASRAPAAAAVVAAVDDPSSDAGRLARAVSTDPGLSGRLMRLANSAYFGLSGRVSSLRFAVTAVGFATVRGLAVSCASGVAGSAGVPAGYWEHACAHAVASGAVAAALGASSPDAFCAGLLADLGRGLFHRADPTGYTGLMAAAGDDPAARLLAERDHFATTHPQVSARLLAAWRLPPLLVEAVADHHAPPSDRSHPLAVAVRVGEEVTQRALYGRQRTSLVTLSRGRVAEETPLVAQVVEQSEALLSAFAGA